MRRTTVISVLIITILGLGTEAFSLCAPPGGSSTTPTGGTVTPPSGGGGPTAPPANGDCPIPPLRPITDPVAQRFEAANGRIADETGLNSNIKSALVCLRGKADFKVTSGWRPQAYQDHLYDVWEKWIGRKLRENTDPACAELKRIVGREITTHGLTSVVGRTSDHSRGAAVDMTSGPANFVELARSCRLVQNVPNDLVHYVYR